MKKVRKNVCVSTVYSRARLIIFNRLFLTDDLTVYNPGDSRQDQLKAVNNTQDSERNNRLLFGLIFQGNIRTNTQKPKKTDCQEREELVQRILMTYKKILAVKDHVII
jgi:hypothetical protein